MGVVLMKIYQKFQAKMSLMFEIYKQKSSKSFLKNKYIIILLYIFIINIILIN